MIDPPAKEIQYSCVAYNGDTGWGSQGFYRGRPLEPPVDKIAVQDLATRNTSRAVAKAVLPKLQF